MYYYINIIVVVVVTSIIIIFFNDKNVNSKNKILFYKEMKMRFFISHSKFYGAHKFDSD